MKQGDLTTREFVIGDYDRAFALWNAVQGVEICESDSREEIHAYLARNPGLSHVVEDGRHDGRRGAVRARWQARLYISPGGSPAYRGRGVGKMLVEACVRVLGNAGLKRAIILVEGKNR